MDLKSYIKEENFSDSISKVWEKLPNWVKEEFILLWRNHIESSAPFNPKLIKEFYKFLPHQIKALDYLGGYMENNKNLVNLFLEELRKTKRHTEAINLIKEFEGLKLEAYPDPLTNGEPWTIGYGSTRYLDGSPVGRNDRITKKVAEELLEGEVQRISKRLSMTIPFWDIMDELMQDALISFAYNLGANFYNSFGFNTISKLLREKRWEEVPNALELYRNPNTIVEKGLLRRRIAEGNLWKRGLRNLKD